MADAGLAGLSVRAVATRAGTSPAQVQYYFRTKAELVHAAFGHASAALLAAVEPVLVGPPALQRLEAAVRQWLPLDGEREHRARVWLAYAGAAVTDPELTVAAARLDGDLRGWFAAGLDELARAGLLREGVDVEAAAAALLALVDGLTVQLLVLPVRRRARLADSVLGAWFGEHAAATSRP